MTLYAQSKYHKIANETAVQRKRTEVVIGFVIVTYKDNFDISHVRFGGGHVGPDDGFVDVWDIPASVVHDRGLEMSS